MPISQSFNQNFFKTWSPEMAYVLGYFAADGCMIQSNNGGYFIEFTSCDKEILEGVKRIINGMHKISIRPRKKEIWLIQYRIQIGSKKWFNDLLSLGFSPRKSNTLCFPQVPEMYLGDFVRGYFDGDGCVYIKAHFAKDRNHERWVFQTQFISGSPDFLTTLWYRLRKRGIAGGHIYTRKSGAANLVFSWKDSVALHRLMYHNGLAQDLFLHRKREKFERAFQVLKLRP